MLQSANSIAIIGGGLGGLAAALSLLHAGFDVHVYERATVLSEVGAGIQVSPNASRILHRLGLADELAKMGVRPLAWHSGAGRTAARCCAPHWPAPSKQLSGSRITRRIAPIS